MKLRFTVGMFFIYISYNTVMLWGIRLLLSSLFGSYIWMAAKSDLFCVNIAQLELCIPEFPSLYMVV